MFSWFTRHIADRMWTGLSRGAARATLAALFALIASFAQVGDAAAQTTGLTIENIAYADYLVNGQPQPTITSPPAIITVQPEDTASELELLRYAHGDPDATDTPTNGTAYSLTGEDDGTFEQQSSASSSDGTLIDSSSPLPLAPVESMISGEPLFIQVTDPGANLDPNEIDTVVVVLTVSITGDQETLLLFETGPDTGVFVGHTQTVEDGVAVYRITYANTGGFMQTNVELTDILPSQTVSTANFVVISGPDILPATNPTGGDVRVRHHRGPSRRQWRRHRIRRDPRGARG